MTDNEIMRHALERIANQGLGTWDQSKGMSMGATGEPWTHWANIADEALASLSKPDTADEPSVWTAPTYG